MTLRGWLDGLRRRIAEAAHEPAPDETAAPSAAEAQDPGRLTRSEPEAVNTLLALLADRDKENR